MNDYRSRQRRRMGLMVSLAVLGIVFAIGPIIYVLSAKPVITDGPTMGPRTH